MKLGLVDIIILVNVFLLLSITLMLVRGARKQKLTGRIKRIHERRTAKPKTAQDMLSLRRQTKQGSPLVAMLLKPLPDFDALQDRLARSGSQLTAKAFVARCMLRLVVCVFLFSVVLKKPILMGLFIGIIFGVWLPFKIISFRINRYLKKFLLLFPDAIDLIVRGLRSGLPVSESIKLVSSEVPPPVGDVFKNIADTMKLGVPLEKALQETAKKLDCTEFNFFTTSIILQRETGGNLSEILSNLSDVLRKRFMMRMKIKAMSSEARASSIIVGALPFVVFIAVFILSPAYMMPLFTDYRGNVWLGVAGGMLFSGVWVMNRMAKFEI